MSRQILYDRVIADSTWKLGHTSRVNSAWQYQKTAGNYTSPKALLHHLENKSPAHERFLTGVINKGTM
jgi:hypothetical protein